VTGTSTSLPARSVPASLVEWAVAARALPGELESGDLHVIELFPDGVLVAVIDALGHGPEAASVARLAASTLHTHASSSVATIVQLCHQELRSTHGAVMSVVSLNAGDATISWLGVGNVDGYVIRADRTTRPRREAIVPRGGVVGYQLPTLRPATIAVQPGDTLVLATDGIVSGFIEGTLLGSPQQVADHILFRYGKTTDDALVLVARYDGAR
jgi:negative regulator of sigma-B (phosphoserine phosphatase)